MRLIQAILLGLCLIGSIGCLNTDPIRYSFGHKSESPQKAVDDGSITILVAVIERPVGDTILNEDVWKLADEQIRDLDKKSLLMENGFRVGLIEQTPPQSLRDLIQSPRSCSDPRKIRLMPEVATQIKVGNLREACSFQIENGSGCQEFTLSQAIGMFEIEARHCPEEGKVELGFIPIVRHGKPGLDRKPITEPGGIMRWNTSVQHKEETFKSIGFSQKLGETDYLIISCWVDKEGTLGQKMFADEEGPIAVQRLMVIRTIQTGEDLSSKNAIHDVRFPTVASQATESNRIVNQEP